MTTFKGGCDKLYYTCTTHSLKQCETITNFFFFFLRNKHTHTKEREIDSNTKSNYNSTQKLISETKI